MSELVPELQSDLLNLAKMISDRSINPMRLWQQDDVPEDINEAYHEFLKKFVGGVPLWRNDLSGKIPTLLTALAVFETFQHLSKLYVENENVLQRYENKNYQVLEKKGLLLELYPELGSRIDKYGLVELPKDVSILGGEQAVGGLGSAVYGVRYKDHVLLLDRRFRRGCHKHNHYNEDFIGRLGKFHSSSGSKVKVRFDPDMVGIPDSFCWYKEADFWHGRPFAAGDLDDPRKVGLAVHRHGAEFTEDGKYRSRLEVLWYLQQDDANIKVLEVEEQFEKGNRDFGVFHDGNAFCRYVHAKRDIPGSRFIHFDGSVNTYSELVYETRQTRYLGQDAKLGNHVKVFQIDGDLSFETLGELLHYFYRGNILVPEYFGNPGSLLKDS